MSERYSHRNGETEPPIVEGLYFFLEPANEDKRLNVIELCWREGYKGQGVNEWDTDILEGWEIWGIGSECESDLVEIDKDARWWGPIVPPWEDAPNA